MSNTVMFPSFIQDTWTATRPRDVVVPCLESEEITSTAHVEQPVLSVTLTRLMALLSEDGRDEDGERGPAQAAFQVAFNLVAGAERLECALLGGSPSVDSEGGIRVTWRAGDREVRLVCPPDRGELSYLYVQSPDASSVSEGAIDAGTLAGKLAWVLGRVHAAQYAR